MASRFRDASFFVSFSLATFIRIMEEYIISVGKIEELQMLNDRPALDAIFQRAKSTLVGGVNVALVRQTADGKSYRFEEITNLEDLEKYRANVYKYVQ